MGSAFLGCTTQQAKPKPVPLCMIVDCCQERTTRVNVAVRIVDYQLSAYR